MTDDDLLSRIRDIVKSDKPTAHWFENGARETAIFCMGIRSTGPYVDVLEGQPLPWRQMFHVAKVAELFNPAPGIISVIMVLHALKLEPWDANQRRNIINAAEYILSPHAFKTLKAGLEHPNATTRQHDAVIDLCLLANIYNTLTSGHESMELEFIDTCIQRVKNNSLFPMCNKDVDAHPVTLNLIQDLIDKINHLIKG